MTTKPIQKSVTYRRCVISSDDGRTLQQLLAAALKKFPNPGSRLEPLNAQSTEMRGIGMHFEERNCLCGFVTSFERGASQPAIEDNPEAASLRLRALAPPEPVDGDAPTQYIPGVLYFVVFGNHVALVTSHAIRGNALEAHFAWLLKSKASELDATVPFALSREAQKATREKIKRSHVKAISFGQPLMAESVTLSPTSGAGSAPARQAGKRSRAFKPVGRMLNVLRQFFDDEEAFERLGLDEVFESNLEVWIQIRYPKRSRSQAENAIQLMDTLAVSLRDMEGEQVSLELADGNHVSGSELKISGTVHAPISSNGLPDERELLKEMVAWIHDQLENGSIDP